MERLKTLLPLWSVESTESEGIDSQNIEAMAFAWLAYRRMHNLPSNIPQVTGQVAWLLLVSYILPIRPSDI